MLFIKDKFVFGMAGVRLLSGMMEFFAALLMLKLNRVGPGHEGQCGPGFYWAHGDAYRHGYWPGRPGRKGLTCKDGHYRIRCGADFYRRYKQELGAAALDMKTDPWPAIQINLCLLK